MKSILNVLTLSVFLFCASCVETKNVSYFTGVNEGTIPATVPIPESLIQKNDLLSVTVSSLNPEASAIFNTPAAPGAPTDAQGYLVNAEGNIQFPILGMIRASGYTKEQLKSEIEKKLIEKQLLKDPIVSIRFLNYRVTVLGEVKNPSVVQAPSEKISLMEALGMAGDLTIYGRRDNVLLIREEGGVKTLKRINLNSAELLSSPYYYLKSNDIVYVEPNKLRIKTASPDNTQTWISLALGILTLGIIVFDRLTL
jgi:polysaccharide biosynthesis/export protein